MAVPTSIDDLSATAASNGPDGGVDLPSAYDDYIRAVSAFIRQMRDGKEQPALLTSVSGADTITASAPASITAYVSGARFAFVSAGANTGAVTLNINSIGAVAVTKRGSTALAAADIASGSVVVVQYDGTRFQLIAPAPSPAAASATVAGIVELATDAEATAGTDTARAVTPANLAAVFTAEIAALQKLGMRQTVMSGPVDGTGLPSFGGSTGSTTVTASGTLVVSAADGFVSSGVSDRIGAITNPSWTGLSTNGTMYLYLDVATDGTCTAGAGTLAPIYSAGSGAASSTLGQFVFDTAAFIGRLGTGSSNARAYRVYVGQVTVSGGVVTAITWYALNGFYDSGYTATLPGVGTAINRNHNIGTEDIETQIVLRCLTAEANYAVGQVVMYPNTSNASYAFPFASAITRTAVRYITSTAAAFGGQNQTTGAIAVLTAANWEYKIIARRTW